MINSQRNLLFVILVFLSFLIWQYWENDKIKFIESKQIEKQIDIFQKKYKKKNSNVIKVKSDVLELSISTYGGDIINANLLLYSDKLFSNRPFHLLDSKRNFIYHAQSGLIGKDGPDSIYYNHGFRPLYSVKSKNFILKKNENELHVPLIYVGKKGVIYKKTYILKRGKYDISIRYDVYNNSNKNLYVSFFGQLKQSKKIPESFESEKIINSYRGSAYSSDKVSYKKYSFNDIEKNNLNLDTFCGWVAMLQQYFVVAWIPSCQNKNNFYTINSDKNFAVIGYKSIPFLIKSSERINYISKIWIGPELQSEMASVAPYLDLSVDYGWLWFISQPLFKLLKFIHSFINNWGFSIIIITFIVRGIMYPLTRAQYISMAKMRFLQPKIIAIKEKNKHNKHKMSQEIIALYKKEKVNPLGGFLPLIIQMPIFLALYYMLISSIELRHAHFFGWIQDLSAKDPYYILPILMGLMMYFFQKISPSTVTDSNQKKIIIYMPIIFTLFFLWFPSGLVLYYIISNLVTVIQQRIICYGLKKRGLYKF